MTLQPETCAVCTRERYRYCAFCRSAETEYSRFTIRHTKRTLTHYCVCGPCLLDVDKHGPLFMTEEEERAAVDARNEHTKKAKDWMSDAS